jgi:hypothetical protein
MRRSYHFRIFISVTTKKKHKKHKKKHRSAIILHIKNTKRQKNPRKSVVSHKKKKKKKKRTRFLYSATTAAGSILNGVGGAIYIHNWQIHGKITKKIIKIDIKTMFCFKVSFGVYGYSKLLGANDYCLIFMPFLGLFEVNFAQKTEK